MALLSQNILLKIEMERLEKFKEKKLNLNLIQEEKELNGGTFYGKFVKVD